MRTDEFRTGRHVVHKLHTHVEAGHVFEDDLVFASAPAELAGGDASAVGRSLLVAVVLRGLGRWSTTGHHQALYRGPAVPQPTREAAI